jgi:hypothetical protein
MRKDSIMAGLLHGVSDPGIAPLATVLDPIELAAYLRPVLPPEWGRLQAVRLHVLQHHPGRRCTLDVAVDTASGWHNLIGKVYATDRGDVYAAMDGITHMGFGPHDEFSIPQPLAYVPALHLLLQDKVGGTVAKTIFCLGETRDRMLAAQRCARWLARFHAVAPRSGRIVALSDHLRALDAWAHQIATLGEPAADQARRLVEGVDIAAAALNRIEGCAGHGSYSPAHVIFTPGRTVVFDWDGYDVADPTRDVARFSVGLQRLALGRLGSIRALDAAAEVFEQTYSTIGRPEVVGRLPF